MKYDVWKIQKDDAEIPQNLVRSGLTPLLALMLHLRGIDNARDAGSFLDGSIDTLAYPFLLKDMDLAVERINQAIKKDELVAVYGDYDVDGITACCLLTEYLQSRGLRCHMYIPDRIGEGYGLNQPAIDSFHNQGVDLIVTVDCGVTALEEAKHASRLGMDIIITDHHECNSQLPEAVAVINPKRPDCGYPDSNLAGVGVAFKLVCALEGDAKAPLDRFSDLVAIGTVADVMPLVGENRYMVRQGLVKLKTNPRLGILALLKEAGARDGKISSSTIGFVLAPRINAAGRLGKVDIAIGLLMTGSDAEGMRFAKQLCDLNKSRQRLETDIWESAREMLRDSGPDQPIILHSDSWHQGVVGIAASRLSEAYGKPVIMICFDGDMGKGSCRSQHSFNLYNALDACREHLDAFGGHALAAGITIRRERLEGFRQAFARYCADHPPHQELSLQIDLRIRNGGLLDMECVQSLERLEPFGNGNPRPLFCVLDALLESVIPIGGERHVKLLVSKFGRRFECVFFSRSARELKVSPGQRIDIAFFPQINLFRSRRSVQLLVTDVRATDVPRLCREILSGKDLDKARGLPPVRRDFALLWTRLLQLGGKLSGQTDELLRALTRENRLGPDMACVCLMVFSELGLVRLHRQGDHLEIQAVRDTGKVDLGESKLLQRLTDYR